MKINTFIVGVPKSGTTSLHYYLDQHPDVSMSIKKEPNYFSSQEISDLYYNIDSVENIDEYHSLFLDLNSQILGESSVSYLFYPSVAKKLFAYNPKAKIIIVLRNPVERAFSHYLMDTRLGFCDVPLLDVINDPIKHNQFYQQFIELGFYSTQIQSYFKIFNENNVKILFYEDLKNDPSNFINKVFMFLNLKHLDIDFSAKNTFKQPVNKLVSVLYKNKFLRYCFRFTPKGLLHRIKKVIFRNSIKPNLSKELRRKLESIYHNQFNELSKLIDNDLSIWKE